MNCPKCKGRITKKANSKFYVCIDGAPIGDPRGWGCGWYGEPEPMPKKKKSV